MSDELGRVRTVLWELQHEQPIWRKNWDVFSHMEYVQQHAWWERAKKQATAGVPAMQELMLRVIEKRLL